jgi:hypothetical protein
MDPWITILDLGTQDTLINTLVAQVDWPFHPFYESYNQIHDDNDIGTMGEPRYKY